MSSNPGIRQNPVTIQGQIYKRIPSQVFADAAVALMQADPLRVWSVHELSKYMPEGLRNAVSLRNALLKDMRVSVDQEGRRYLTTLRLPPGQIDVGKLLAAEANRIAAIGPAPVVQPTHAPEVVQPPVSRGLPDEFYKDLLWALDNADAKPIGLAIVATRIMEWHKDVTGQQRYR